MATSWGYDENHVLSVGFLPVTFDQISGGTFPFSLVYFFFNMNFFFCDRSV